MFYKSHFMIFLTTLILKGSEKKIRSQQLTPKNDKKEKEFHSVAAKSFSTPFNFQQNSSKLEQSLNNEKKNSTLKECQNKIEFYQKVFYLFIKKINFENQLYDDQLKEKIILSELIESVYTLLLFVKKFFFLQNR